MIKFYPTDVFYIPSKIVDQLFKISVQRPPSIDDQDKDLPVIYCTDADVYFDVLSSISTLLHTSGSTLRPYLLVGVGYPTKHPLGSERLRARDLTFEGFPRLSYPPAPPWVTEIESGGKDFFGGYDFLHFIRDELMPSISNRYRIDDTFRGLFGHSGGGGLGLYSLFRYRDIFTHYIISSPGIYYDGPHGPSAGYQPHFLDNALEQYVRLPLLDSRVAVRISAGSLEESEPAYRHWRLTSSAKRMAILLQRTRRSDLDVSFEEIAGENHITVLPVSFIHGIRWALTQTSTKKNTQGQEHSA